MNRDTLTPESRPWTQATSLAFAILLAFATLLTSRLASAAIVKKAVEYKADGKTFEGYVAYDDAAKEPKPGVLVTHDWMGLTDKTKASADRIAELGYVAFAVDVYGKGVRPKTVEEASSLAGALKKDRELLRKRMRQGLANLQKQSGVDGKKLGVIGYCFGGTAAIELARAGAELKSVVSFHGGLDSPKPTDGKNIKARVLALHGADDPYVPAADLAAFEEEMRKSGVDWQLVKYGGAVHSFTDKTAGTDASKGAAYNESADHRSWEAMKQFFKETL